MQNVVQFILEDGKTLIGKRYEVTTYSFISLNGGPDFIPGTIEGTVDQFSTYS